MRTEEYLAILTEQIRCKKARSTVSEELRQHIEDQKAAFIEAGMEANEAEAAAVLEMGDPVETGIELDRVHRPKMAWGILSLIVVLSLIGFAVQYFLQRNFTEASFLPGNVIRSLTYILIGFAVMLGVCLVDYSRIGYHAKEITIVLFCVLCFGVHFFGVQINGARSWIYVGGVAISVRQAVLLFVPLYGAVLYSLRGQGYRAVGKGLLWMLPAVITAYLCPSVATTLVLFFTFMIMLCVAIYKNWFRVSRKRTLTALLGCVILSPAAGYAWVMQFGAEYQKLRLQAYMGTADTVSYLTQRWEQIQAGELVPDNGAYVLAYVMSYYGILAGILLTALLTFLFLWLLRSSLQQKNQLGMLMGVGSASVLIVQLVAYVLDNLGVIPVSCGYCPFITYGGAGCIVTYILLGIMLSIYRYQNVLAAQPEVKVGFGIRRYRSE